MILLALACTGADVPVGTVGSGWLAPEDVGVESVDGFHGEAEQEIIFGDGDFTDADFARFSLEIDDTYMDVLESEGKYDEHVWVPATMVYEGVRYENIGVRIKGENSFLPIWEKASLKLKFDKFNDGLRFAGLKELTLNNMSNDYSMMHERVGYRLMREAGIPSSRSNHVLVEINGEDFGLYASVEGVDKTMAKRWFDDPDGSMFEVWDVDFVDYYVDDFQLEFGEDDRTHIQGAADAMESWSISELEDHMDVEQFVRFWAAEAVIGQYDSYPYSNPGDDAHIFVDPSQDRIVWLPHGMDETFYYPDNDPRSVNGVVARACLNDTECAALLYSTVWEIQGIAEEIELGQYARDVRDHIEDRVDDDPHRPYTMQYVSYYQDVMISFIDGRASKLTQWFGERP